MSVRGGPTVVTSGLILYLDAANPKSYPGSGPIWYDVSSNGNHGFIMTGALIPMFVASGAQSHFYFTGTNFGFDGTGIAALDYQDVMIGYWAAPTGSPGTVINTLFCKYNQVDKSLRLDYSELPGALRGGLGVGHVTDANDWQNGQTTSTYANGVPIATQNTTTGQWTIVRSYRTEASFSPPFQWQLGQGSASRGFNGRIAFVMGYNRQLTYAEMTQNWNALRPRFNL